MRQSFKRLSPLWFLPFSLLLTGFTLKGAPRDTAPVEKALETLPTCTMGQVEKGRFNSITVVKHHTLGKQTDHGHQYWIGAQSFFRSGNVYIDVNQAADPSYVLHEIGHWWEHDNLKPYQEAWDMAVKADFADQSLKDAQTNAYLQDPGEAFAELFAYHFLGANYDKHYKVDLFPRSNAMLAMILNQSCK